MVSAKPSSLEDLLNSVPNVADFFYNETEAPHSRASTRKSPVPMEFEGWRKEQRGWREAAVIFDQSHHMPEMFLKGPDALKLLSHVGINSLANFGPGRAKQLVACNNEGYVIGDCILFWRGENDFELVSGMTLQDWVEFQAKEGNFDVRIERDPPTSLNPGNRTLFRYELEGPAAAAIFAQVVDGEAPVLEFFRTAEVTIAGCPILVLRHGMAGHSGLEISGPWERGAEVKAAILKAGEKHGLRQAGQLAYYTTVTESAWMAYPVPAIYTGDGEMRKFREWLPANSWEAHTQLAGSFYSKDIEDYYNNPWDLGYDRILKFDHDFIGRAALEKMAREPQRKKVTLVWDDDDVARIQASQGSDRPFKKINLPLVSYGFPQCDEVRDRSGKLIGLSNFSGYSENEGKVLSLAMLDAGQAEIGTELALVWGEPNGGSRKAHVEPHHQTEVRVTVAPAPYAAPVREMRSKAVLRTGT